MTELTKSTVCPFCGSQLSSEHHNEYELAKKNARLWIALTNANNASKLQDGTNYEKALNQLYEIYKITQEALKNE